MLFNMLCVLTSSLVLCMHAGFGFFVDEKTGAVVKKPQELMVHIGNNVQIGANTCVDRGSWRDTLIGDNTKIDNLVQASSLISTWKKLFRSKSIEYRLFRVL